MERLNREKEKLTIVDYVKKEANIYSLLHSQQAEAAFNCSKV